MDKSDFIEIRQEKCHIFSVVYELAHIEYVNDTKGVNFLRGAKLVKIWSLPQKRTCGKKHV